VAHTRIFINPDAVLEQRVDCHLIAGIQRAMIAFGGNDYAHVNATTPCLGEFVDCPIIRKVGVLDDDVALRIPDRSYLGLVDLGVEVLRLQDAYRVSIAISIVIFAAQAGR
jgi:hypothetical protein